ncbi:carbon-nitrogen hydrolase family protein [Modestobacter sp. I12A-02628]|uniref:Carbon-nitrogen hydrolase family protein n=1 Tax=Goekera deserti TaxID=2497753 RepID=A0A7K3WAC3_9ACTN|nr:carbon-nitrogen hydrolase family protein [Goekera deserti]MPQ99131.1 carbon-nitrogen hydrolase family protein [Goekera deserti]NDI47465.1 carbon-nitrogen hydrolase family protein [Goekera deserti]NEL53276.1 carbon-nitrogen hydrolase family protein [Goekera deserti]
MTLQVAVVQSGGQGSDPAAGLEQLCALVEQAATPGTDLVVLPELCSSPYFCTTRDAARHSRAEPLSGPTTTAFAALAARLGVAVMFGVYERAADGSLYNSAVLLDRTGALVRPTALDGTEAPAYRKMSIPSVCTPDLDTDEKFYFKPGPEPVAFTLDGVRLGCVICYDRSFPEYWLAARALGAQVVVALVSSFGWRDGLFVDELVVRAFETQVFVVAANRGGPETFEGATTSFFGRSCVIDPTGVLLAEAPAHESPVTLHATLDLAAVDAARSRLPLARDRRADVLALLARAAR